MALSIYVPHAGQQGLMRGVDVSSRNGTERFGQNSTRGGSHHHSSLPVPVTGETVP